MVGIRNVANNPTFWIGFILLLVAWVIVFVWLAAYKITIDRNFLSYSVLIKGTVSVCRGDIVEAEMPAGRFEHVIVIRSSAGEPIIINTKPFSKNDLRTVVGFLADKMVEKPDWL